MTAPRRQKGGYFPFDPSAPAPLIVQVTHRVRFSQVDALAITWHGRYAELFEQGNEELGRLIGMDYPDFFREKIKAPIVQLHIDYFAPLMLGELATITAKLIWTDAARSNIEYQIMRQAGQLAASGYTVQMFLDETDTPLMAPPPLLERCRQRWIAGEFAATQGEAK